MGKGKPGEKEPKDGVKKRQRFMSGEEGQKKRERKRHNSAEDMLRKRDRTNSGERLKKRERTISTSGDEEKGKGKRKPRLISPDRKKVEQKSKHTLSQEGTCIYIVCCI